MKKKSFYEEKIQMHLMQQAIRTITKKAAQVAASALLLAAAVAFAHGGFEHVIGTVTQTSAENVSVQTKDGKVVVVAVTAKTTYSRDSKAVTAGDLKVGDRVVIDATPHDGGLTAASVKLGNASAKTAAPHAEHA